MDNNDYIEFEGARRYQPDALHYRMAKRIAELEAQLDAAASRLNDKSERIAELEFQMSLKWPGVWQPVEDLTPEMVMSDLPDDCAICRKIQPAA